MWLIREEYTERFNLVLFVCCWIVLAKLWNVSCPSRVKSFDYVKSQCRQGFRLQRYHMGFCLLRRRNFHHSLHSNSLIGLLQRFRIRENSYQVKVTKWPARHRSYRLKSSGNPCSIRMRHILLTSLYFGIFRSKHSLRETTKRKRKSFKHHILYLNKRWKEWICEIGAGGEPSVSEDHHGLCPEGLRVHGRDHRVRLKKLC